MKASLFYYIEKPQEEISMPEDKNRREKEEITLESLGIDQQMYQQMEAILSTVSERDYYSEYGGEEPDTTPIQREHRGIEEYFEGWDDSDEIIDFDDMFMRIDVVISVGLDFDKVDEDGLDLDDDDNYTRVHLTQDDLDEIDLDIEAILAELGMDDMSDAIIHFLMLPEEYYFTKEEGGFDYPQTYEEYRNRRVVIGDSRDNRVKDVKKEDVEEAILEEEETFQEMVDYVYRTYKINVLEFKDDVVEELEKLRDYEGDKWIERLEDADIDSMVEKGNYRGSELSVRGYFQEEGVFDNTNILIKAVNFIVDVGDMEGVWVLGFSALYPMEEKEEDYNKMLSTYPELCKYKLDTVVYATEDELDDIIENGF